MNEITAREKAAYDKGFLDSLEAYAHMKDGVFYVGTTGKTLADAKANIENNFNYWPRVES